MQTLLNRVGSRFRHGCLEFRADDGRVWRLGQNEPLAVLRLLKPEALLKILLNPELYFGECYMNGDWEPADGSLRQVLEVATCMANSISSGPLDGLLHRAIGWLGELNNPLRSRSNVHRHYDLDYALYSGFLDQEMYYSCAYFNDRGHDQGLAEGMSLEAAQQAKCEHIAAKLDLKPGARVLDIGCGWGSLALDLARRFDARVTGITLSEEQLQVAQRRARERGLERQVQFRLEDYRDTRGEFDAVVSVGMFEHVGRPQYKDFFRQVRNVLAPDGTALLHTIGRSSPPGGSSSWIRKYIFPGGYIPAASELMAAMEPQGLILADLEVWRLHYARTLAEWHKRFQANRAHFAARLGERFCRMWEFYLLVSEASFRWGSLVVFQAQMERRLGRLPLTRDYLYSGDRRRSLSSVPVRKQA
jgi:cyclopropane-fatty-acyl-phospholipid synthase